MGKAAIQQRQSNDLNIKYDINNFLLKKKLIWINNNTRNKKKRFRDVHKGNYSVCLGRLVLIKLISFSIRFLEVCFLRHFKDFCFVKINVALLINKSDLNTQRRRVI